MERVDFSAKKGRPCGNNLAITARIRKAMTQNPAFPFDLPPPPGPHIRRRDDLHSRGWLVRVQQQAYQIDRLFSDSIHGGMAQALAAAQAWRDQQPWYRQGKRGRPRSLAAPAGAPLLPGINIRRIGNVWVVRVDKRDYKVERRFSDKAFGGMVQALAAAQAWRNQQPWYRPPGGRPVHPRVSEVMRHERLLDIDGQQRQCTFWSVSWQDADGRIWTRKFSVGFWGEAAARQKAEAIRAYQLSQTPGRKSA